MKTHLRRPGRSRGHLLGMAFAAALPASGAVLGTVDFGPPLSAETSPPSDGIRPAGLAQVRVRFGPAATLPWIHPGPVADLDRVLVQADPAAEFIEVRITADPGFEVRIEDFDLAAEGDEELVPALEVADADGRVAVHREFVPVEGLGGAARRIDCDTPYAAGWCLRIRVAHDSDVEVRAVGLDNLRLALRTASGIPAGIVTLSRGSGGVVLRWDDTSRVLEAAPTPDGAWQVIAHRSPHTEPVTGDARWFRAAPAPTAAIPVP